MRSDEVIPKIIDIAAHGEDVGGVAYDVLLVVKVRAREARDSGGW